MSIEFIPEASEEYNSLDGSIRILADKKLDQLDKNHYLGEELGNKYNLDLTGYYKLYFRKKTYRIVYRIIKNGIEIAEIWGIGKKDKMEIYRDIDKRIKDRK